MRIRSPGDRSTLQSLAQLSGEEWIAHVQELSKQGIPLPQAKEAVASLEAGLEVTAELEREDIV
eukprot:1848621-Amphidinium_carterae.1